MGWRTSGRPRTYIQTSAAAGCNGLSGKHAPACGVQHAFTFEADAGPGFSGGPVVDATDGRLVGIVFGFQDEKDGGRLMYAYDMDRVAKELAIVEKQPYSR